MKFIYLLFVVFLIASCGTLKKPYYSSEAEGWEVRNSISEKELLHTLYLVGDAGDFDDLQSRQNYVLNALKKDLEKENSKSSLVFLGDNIYPAGLPKKKDVSREVSEAKINNQLEAARDFLGTTYFIPGNHDWNKYHGGGLKAIQRQEEYVESYYDVKGKVNFYPNDGCADPKVVKINKDLVYLFIDTQWWLQDWSKEKKINQGCDIKSRYDFMKRVEEELIDHKNDEIVILMHHPIKTNGLHGGNFSWKHHIFPLHEKNIWIPLPILGSVYPMYRQVTGSKQDITHEDNIAIMRGIESIAKSLRINVLFASGHEHGLQYFSEGKMKYVVSGAGSKNTFTKNGGQAEYARDARGYVKVKFYEDFESWAEFYTISGFGAEPVLEYRTMVRAPRAGTVEEEIKYPPVEDEKLLLAANLSFEAGPIKRAFMGKQYREMWATPVTLPVIDLSTELGGLTPIKKGGGMASNSLRMERDGGNQYILRSINKDYRKLVPPGFENLKLLNVLKDQNSASHPYGALIIPTLSKAAGVYYTNPKLVYLKHQKALGNYNSQFPEEMYLLEERPSGDWSHYEQFGYSKDIIGYVDLLNILREKKNHFVDQRWVLKSRLFDLLIHDWDRHDDQWRWASFEEDGKTVYRPIPRDRDQAFYKFVGLVPSYIAGFMMKKFKTMKGEVKDVKHLAFNAKHFDRYFLNELEWDEWLEVINELQSNITDDVIENSMNGIPKETRHTNDQELIQKLKSRRDDMIIYAQELYEFLSKEVEIAASDNQDHFIITRYEDGRLNVNMHIERDNKGELVKYDRTFDPKVTREVRLYGLRGKDDFEIKGVKNGPIKVRIIGGEDKDEINNPNGVKGVYGYDNKGGLDINGDNIKDKRSKALDVNEYDRNGFEYNTNFPSLSFGITPDDGLWLGGAINWTSHGWRNKPYRAKQSFSFSVAPGSQNAFNIGYAAHFPNVIGELGLAPDLNVHFPQYENFFGLGNNSVNNLREVQFNWVRMQTIDVAPLFQWALGPNSLLKFGPQFRSIDIDPTEGRVSTDEVLGFTEDEMERRNYLGAKMLYEVGFVDNPVFPHNGFKWNMSYSYLNELSREEIVSDFKTDFNFYLQLFSSPEIILANSIGYHKTWGDRQFYQFADLGNSTHLRGYRKNRFRGEAAFFHNIDLRFHLFEWDNNVLPMHVGILGGYDYGKVYLSGQESDQWHKSQTIGVFMEILGAAVIQPYLSFNEEESRFSLKMGFNF